MGVDEFVGLTASAVWARDYIGCLKMRATLCVNDCWCCSEKSGNEVGSEMHDDDGDGPFKIVCLCDSYRL